MDEMDSCDFLFVRSGMFCCAGKRCKKSTEIPGTPKGWDRLDIQNSSFGKLGCMRSLLGGPSLLGLFPFKLPDFMAYKFVLGSHPPSTGMKVIYHFRASF